MSNLRALVDSAFASVQTQIEIKNGLNVHTMTLKNLEAYAQETAEAALSGGLVDLLCKMAKQHPLSDKKGSIVSLKHKGVKITLKEIPQNVFDQAAEAPKMFHLIASIDSRDFLNLRFNKSGGKRTLIKQNGINYCSFGPWIRDVKHVFEGAQDEINAGKVSRDTAQRKKLVEIMSLG